MLDKALAFYGDEGKKNGVQIDFNQKDPGALGSTSTKNGITTISFGKDAFSNMQQAGKGETVAHEGTHGVDQRKQGMPQTFWQFYGTEYHAYQAESAVDKGLGVRNETDEHPAWFPRHQPPATDNQHYKRRIFQRLLRRLRRFLPMIRFFLTLAVIAVFVFVSQCSAAPMQTKASGASVSLCQILSQPEHYLDGSASIKVRVKMYRHGTSISDRSCPKQRMSLIADDSVLNNEDVKHFYRFLAEHRQSPVPINAILTGRTTRDSDAGFAAKRDFVFKLESVIEVAEAHQKKKP